MRKRELQALELKLAIWQRVPEHVGSSCCAAAFQPRVDAEVSNAFAVLLDEVWKLRDEVAEARKEAAAPAYYSYGREPDDYG